MNETAPKLDILETLQTAVRAWWIEFAPITLLGFLLLTAPSLILQVAFGPGVRAGGVDSVGTIAQTLLGVLSLLYFCTVAFGVLSGLAGRRLDVRTFMAAGLRAAQPGLQASLVLAVFGLGAVSMVIAGQLLGTGGALLLVLPAVAALLWGASALLPAMPAAIAERKGPMAALRRGLALTAGQRWRLLGLVIIVAVALLPPLGVVNLVIFGPDATPQKAEAIAASLSLSDPRLWIAQLTSVLFGGLLACLPPVIYVQLIRLKGGVGRPATT